MYYDNETLHIFYFEFECLALASKYWVGRRKIPHRLAQPSGSQPRTLKGRHVAD